jgi:hypothetical protein
VVPLAAVQIKTHRRIVQIALLVVLRFERPAFVIALEVMVFDGKGAFLGGKILQSAAAVILIQGGADCGRRIVLIIEDRVDRGYFDIAVVAIGGQACALGGRGLSFLRGQR